MVQVFSCRLEPKFSCNFKPSCYLDMHVARGRHVIILHVTKCMTLTKV